MKAGALTLVVIALLCAPCAFSKITLANVVSVTASATTIVVNARTILHKTKAGAKAVKHGAVTVVKAAKGK
jgi:hypothetical protein